MTIAVGFCSNDGVVLCADSQETISGYIKTFDGKVVTVIYKNLVMAIAGSGAGDYVKTARDALTDEFPECKTHTDVRKALEDRLLAFFDKHIARWAYFEERDRPSVELLVAFCGRGSAGKKIGHSLFHYSGTSFHRTTAKAIGARILLANNMIHRYAFGNHNVDELTSVATFILQEVKDKVDGCGGGTHIVALRKGGDFAFSEDTDVRQAEKEYAQLDKNSSKDLKAEILRRPIKLSWHSEYLKRRRDQKLQTAPQDAAS